MTQNAETQTIDSITVPVFLNRPIEKSSSKRHTRDTRSPWNNFDPVSND